MYAADTLEENQFKRQGQMLAQYLKPLAAYLEDTEVNEICVNQPGEIWIERNTRWEQVHSQTLTYEFLENLTKTIANFNKKVISKSNPIVSASLPQGERVQMVVSPACEADTLSITIRKPSLVTKSLEQLSQEGVFERYLEAEVGLKKFEKQLLHLKTTDISAFLELAVKRHQNILLVGKTGSGKTTIAKSLIQKIDCQERLITIEDVHELVLDHHPNKVHLFYGSAEQGITAKQALESALRMRPDRILLAELRGDEAWDYVKSINTGHPGSISTMHANGALETFDRLTALIKDSRAGAHLDTNYIKTYLFQTLDVVLFFKDRKLKEVYYDPTKRLTEC